MIFVWWDYGLNLALILDVLLEKWFAIFGIITFLIFTALAITSTKEWQQKMGKNWKKLHRFVYAAGILAALHFILAVKPGVLRPWPYALAMTLLLLYRLPPVQAWVKKTI